MGLAKSLRKAGYLDQVKEGLTYFGDYLEKKRKAEEQREFVDTVVRLYDKWKQGQLRAQEEGLRLKEGGKVANVFSPEVLADRKTLGGGPPRGMNLNVNIPGGMQPPITEPTAPDIQTEIKPQEERYQEAQNNYSSFLSEIAPLIMNPNIEQQQIDRANVLSNLAKIQTEALKPKEDAYFDLNQGERRYRLNPTTKKIEEVAYNPKQETTSTRTEKKDFKVSEDGYYMYWDDGKNDWVKTSQKAPKEKGDANSVGWARLFYEMDKDKEELSKKKKESQGKYNSIMGSTFLSSDELVKQGLLKSNDDRVKDFGGAYVVRDDKDYKNYKLLFTDDELQDYAENIVPDAPNKWGRQDPAGIQGDNENDPLGIR